MAKSKTEVINRLKKKAKGAWGKAKKKKAQPRGRLPAGIVNGVAELQVAELREASNGGDYVIFQGTVKEPEECKGRKASILCFLDESEWRTADECWDELSANLQLLGKETAEMGDVEDMLAALEELQEEQPHFKFDTVAGKKDKSKVYTNITGLAEGYEPTESKDEVVDDDGDDSADDDPEADASDDDGGDGDSDTDASDDWAPEKGEIYGYKVNSRAKVKNCEVTSVNKSKEAVSLKSEDGKTYKDISWDKLLDAE